MYTLNDHPIGFEEYCGAPTLSGGRCKRVGYRAGFDKVKFRCHMHKGYVPPPPPDDPNSYGNRLDRYLDGEGPMPEEWARGPR